MTAGGYCGSTTAWPRAAQPTDTAGKTAPREHFEELRALLPVDVTPVRSHQLGMGHPSWSGYVVLKAKCSPEIQDLGISVPKGLTHSADSLLNFKWDGAPAWPSQRSA